MRLSYMLIIALIMSVQSSVFYNDRRNEYLTKKDILYIRNTFGNILRLTLDVKCDKICGIYRCYISKDYHCPYNSDAYTERTQNRKMFIEFPIRFTAIQLELFCKNNIENIISFIQMYNQNLTLIKSAWLSVVDYKLDELLINLWDAVSSTEIPPDITEYHSDIIFDITNIRHFNKFSSMQIYRLYRAIIPVFKIEDISWLFDKDNEDYTQLFLYLRIVFSKMITASSKDWYNLYTYYSVFKNSKNAEYATRYNKDMCDLVYYMVKSTYEYSVQNNIYDESYPLSLSMYFFSTKQVAGFITKFIDYDIAESLYVGVSNDKLTSIRTKLQTMMMNDEDNHIVKLFVKLYDNLAEYYSHKIDIIVYDINYLLIIIDYIKQYHTEKLHKDYSAILTLAFNHLSSSDEMKRKNNYEILCAIEIDYIIARFRKHVINEEFRQSFGKMYFDFIMIYLFKNSDDSNKDKIIKFVENETSPNVCLEFIMFLITKMNSYTKDDKTCEGFTNVITVDQRKSLITEIMHTFISYIVSIDKEIYVKKFDNINRFNLFLYDISNDKTKIETIRDMLISGPIYSYLKDCSIIASGCIKSRLDSFYSILFGKQ